MHKRVRVLRQKDRGKKILKSWFRHPSRYATLVLLTLLLGAQGAAVFTVQPVGGLGFDILADGKLVAPIRLAAEDAIQAGNVVTNATAISFSALHTKDPLAVTFAPD